MTGATPRGCQGVALAAGAFALLAAAVGPLPAVAGVASLGTLAHGVLAGNRSTTRIGGAGLLAAAVLAGVTDGRVAVVLLAAPPAVVAWDAGVLGVRLGETTGREAVSLRPQVLHLAATAVVVAGTAYGAHALYGSARTGRASPLALVLLLAGGFALAAALWLGE